MTHRTTNTSQRSISGLTRRKVFQVVVNGKYYGELEEVDFLSRLYDLKKLPSTDGRFKDARGDIIQHRVANYDWDESWIFSDDRFGLQTGSDESFLRFVSEAVNPEVRGDPDESQQMVRQINTHLGRDGWELVPVSQMSGYAVYGPRRRSPTTTERPDDFPIDPDPLIGSIAEILKSRGQARELALLADCRIRIEQESYDNWNGGSKGWAIVCSLDAALYSRLAGDEVEAAEGTVKEIANDFFRPYSHHFVEKVLFIPSSDYAGEWRTAANAWLSGKGINNQGRVRTDNIASLEVDGLLFRSEAEINLYRALKRKGVTFAPLPVFLRGGASYARLEPDFLLLKDARVMVVEVDGDTFHRESPAEAHQRLLPLYHEGAHIERVAAKDCETPEKAIACAEQLLSILEKMRLR